MSTYSPFMAAPLDVLAQRLEVLECVGYHYVYKYGRVNPLEMISDFDPPFASGITFRVFFYRPDDKAHASMAFIGSRGWFLFIFLDGTKVKFSSSSQSGSPPDEVLREATGQFFSIAIQAEGIYMRDIGPEPT
nr:uncharacterized protein LOC129383097 isoform X1 [Dermacentor andersoni]